MQPAPTTERKQEPQTGDPCCECDGHLVVYSTQRRGSFMARYLKCWSCGWKPAENKQLVRAAEVSTRRKRNRTNNVNSATT